MNPRIARWAGTTIVVTLLLSIGLFALLTSGKVLVSQRGALGGSLVRAEFRDAWPLVPGMTVRISGAVAGSVEDIKLSDHGTALVGLRLARGVPLPRADATAAIRQQDVLGDSYVALTLGGARGSLTGPIPMRRTIVMPRMDDVFDTFRAPVRAALHALVTEFGTAFEGRGDDLNELLLKLRPGLDATDAVLQELGSQRTRLRQVVGDAERLTNRLARRTDDLTGAVAQMRQLAQDTERHAPALEATLTRAPATMQAARRTLDRTTSLTAQAIPLANRLEQAAPGIARVLDRFGPFTGDAQRSLDAARPVLQTLKSTLLAAQPINHLLPTLDPVDVLLPASGVLEVLSPVFGDGARALFGASTYGAEPRNQAGLGAVAVERGDQPSTPDEDPRRMWLRTGIVLSCESFGRPIKPGCLADLLLGDAEPTTVSASADARRSPIVRRALQRITRDDDTTTQLLDYLLR